MWLLSFVSGSKLYFFTTVFSPWSSYSHFTDNEVIVCTDVCTYERSIICYVYETVDVYYMIRRYWFTHEDIVNNWFFVFIDDDFPLFLVREKLIRSLLFVHNRVRILQYWSTNVLGWHKLWQMNRMIFRWFLVKKLVNIPFSWVILFIYYTYSTCRIGSPRGKYLEIKLVYKFSESACQYFIPQAKFH